MKYFGWVSECKFKGKNKVNEIFNVKKSLETSYDCTNLGSHIEFNPILSQLEQQKKRQNGCTIMNYSGFENLVLTRVRRIRLR